jgi:F-type H+-transporting ATPase subunit delta
LGTIARVLQMPSARTIFASPAVAAPQKAAALDHIVPSAPPTIRNFLHILVERDRVYEVPEILEALQELINRQRGIITAEVTTAVPLDAELERVVAQRLAAYLRSTPDKVTIHSQVDPSIIGGVVARVGDEVIDDSVRGRIERLRRTLAGSA